MFNKHLLSLQDFSQPQLQTFLVRSMILKEETRKGIRQQPLSGKTICMLFEKASTRTRVSFESAMYSLGGQVIYLSSRDSQLGRGEPLKDTARVLSRYVDGIVVRTFGQEIVDELARYSDVPVINALTDLHHPCQVLSDIMTVIEKKGTPENLEVVWIGDGNNMANSWIQAASVLGFALTLACPEGYEPDSEILSIARMKGSRPINVTYDPIEAIEDADVVSTDVWASMGQEEEADERMEIFKQYQLNKELLSHAEDDVMVLHCLPAHRGEEITEEVLEGPQSVVFDQAENKLHMHKAILNCLLEMNPQTDD